jgi:hypothetical protein
MDIQTSEVDAKLSPVNVGPWNFACWQIFKGWTTFNKIDFVKNQKYEHGGWLEVKNHILRFWDYVRTNAEQLCVESVFIWCDNGIIVKRQYHFMIFFIKDVLNIRDTNMAAKKYSRLYINSFVVRIYNMD